MQDSRLRHDPKTGAYFDVQTGATVEKLPPTQRYKYHVHAPGEGGGVQIEQTFFKHGALLGTGNVSRDYWRCWLCDFEPAKPEHAPHLLNQGRILALLTAGKVVETAIAS